MASEEISRFNYDHHLISISGSRFHANHNNLRIWMVKTTSGESAEVLCRWLIRSGRPLGQWDRKGGLSGVWDDTLGIISRKVIPLLLLRLKSQLRTC